MIIFLKLGFGITTMAGREAIMVFVGMEQHLRPHPSLPVSMTDKTMDIRVIEALRADWSSDTF